MKHNSVLKHSFNEGELKSSILEMPQRFFDAITFEIEAEIYTLELAMNSQAAIQPGAIGHLAGGTYYLRNLLDTLVSCREIE